MKQLDNFTTYNYKNYITFRLINSVKNGNHFLKVSCLYCFSNKVVFLQHGYHNIFINRRE